MIDTADNQTQSLQLEQKRGRGRPATGQAMTDAEKQRAYRERKKSNVTKLEERLARNVTENIDELNRKNRELEAVVRELSRNLGLKEQQLRMWIERAENAERELESREIVTKTPHHVESRAPRCRTWARVGEDEPFTSLEQAERFMEGCIAGGSHNKYRAVPA